MKFATIVAAVDGESLAQTPSISLHLADEERGVHAIEMLFDLFGDDKSIAGISVVIDGRSVGSVRREALYGLVTDKTMKIGDSSGLSLPGIGLPAYRRLHCPVAGCTGRAICAPDLGFEVPIGKQHDRPMVSDETR